MRANQPGHILAGFFLAKIILFFFVDIVDRVSNSQYLLKTFKFVGDTVGDCIFTKTKKALSKTLKALIV
ncbi:uncharacterized protein TOL2_C42470 [Desulfobacula toluolica Tol2]|uniref:Uncharacterized protein n=1 Tax=Desulfobacula toluolica (strain DSM 7467 / Tol2) TaxID=651182 RepID=K0NQG4_DESTT|nr:uncharacterized protein TOL2_C42470 [Desulfobacula toluolica Tol2]